MAGSIDYMDMLRSARKEAALTRANKSSISIIPSFEISNESQTHDLSIQSAIFKTKVYNKNTIDYLNSKFESETEWFQVGGRNVAIFGGVPHPSGAIVEPLPAWLLPISQQLQTSSSARTIPAHCINIIPDTFNIINNNIIIAHPPSSASSSTPTTNIETNNKNMKLIRRYSLTFRRLSHVAKTLDEFGPCNQEERMKIVRRKQWWSHAITDT